MKIKTFRDLLEALKTLDDNQLSCNLTICDSIEDEYYPLVTKLLITEEDDVLDENHPFLAVNYFNNSGTWSINYEN